MTKTFEHKAYAIIPARYGSSRFPGKPLAVIKDRPMIQWVYETTSRSSLLSGVIVATDDKRIYKCVENFGGNVIMTSSNNSCGTDRVAEAANQFPDGSIFLNIQGDTPLISPDLIESLIRPLRKGECDMTTLRTGITSSTDFININTVKVVVDYQDYVLYFSRAPIPFAKKLTGKAYRHIGLYGFTKESLTRFASMPQSPLEIAEGLEQLRALENGYKIKCILTPRVPEEVNVPDDIGRIEANLEKSKLVGGQ